MGSHWWIIPTIWSTYFPWINILGNSTVVVEEEVGCTNGDFESARLRGINFEYCTRFGNWIYSLRHFLIQLCSFYSHNHPYFRLGLWMANVSVDVSEFAFCVTPERVSAVYHRCNKNSFQDVRVEYFPWDICKIWNDMSRPLCNMYFIERRMGTFDFSTGNLKLIASLITGNVILKVAVTNTSCLPLIPFKILPVDG